MLIREAVASTSTLFNDDCHNVPHDYIGFSFSLEFCQNESCGVLFKGKQVKKDIKYMIECT